MRRELHDGQRDGLVPLEPLDLAEINSFSDLLHSMSKTAFSGRQLGEAFDVLCAMAQDEDCSIVLTLSGAMTVAKQGKIICDLIDAGLVAAVVSTGALIAHGLTESIGLTHYRYDASQNDEALYAQGYNRIYDTLEMEANLNDVERIVSDVFTHATPEDGTWSSARICRALGSELSQRNEGPGILRSAFEHDVPVYIPAFTDSEVGLDVATCSISQMLSSHQDMTGASPDEILASTPAFNPFLDLQDYARRAVAAERLGIFTIGGGVPRNWAQQVAPYIEIINTRLGTKLKMPRFQYGVRICPEPTHWGGLSGCTYSEGVSWGKFVSPQSGGRFAEVYADATVVLPLLIKAVFERLGV